MTEGDHGLPHLTWVTAGDHWLPWVTTGDHGFPMVLKSSHRFPLVHDTFHKPTGFYGFPSKVYTGPLGTMGFYWLPQVITGDLG